MKTNLFAARCKVSASAGLHHPQIRLERGARWMPLELAVEYGVLTAEDSTEVIRDLAWELDAEIHGEEFSASDFPTVYFEYPPEDAEEVIADLVKEGAKRLATLQVAKEGGDSE